MGFPDSAGTEGSIEEVIGLVEGAEAEEFSAPGTGDDAHSCTSTLNDFTEQANFPGNGTAVLQALALTSTARFKLSSSGDTADVSKVLKQARWALKQAEARDTGDLHDVTSARIKALHVRVLVEQGDWLDAVKAWEHISRDKHLWLADPGGMAEASFYAGLACSRLQRQNEAPGERDPYGTEARRNWARVRRVTKELLDGRRLEDVTSSVVFLSLDDDAILPVPADQVASTAPVSRVPRRTHAYLLDLHTRALFELACLFGLLGRTRRARLYARRLIAVLTSAVDAGLSSVKTERTAALVATLATLGLTEMPPPDSVPAPESAPRTGRRGSSFKPLSRAWDVFLHTPGACRRRIVDDTLTKLLCEENRTDKGLDTAHPGVDLATRFWDEPGQAPPHTKAVKARLWDLYLGPAAKVYVLRTTHLQARYHWGLSRFLGLLCGDVAEHAARLLYAAVGIKGVSDLRLDSVAAALLPMLQHLAGLGDGARATALDLTSATLLAWDRSKADVATRPPHIWKKLCALHATLARTVLPKGVRRSTELAGAARRDGRLRLSGARLDAAISQFLVGPSPDRRTTELLVWEVLRGHPGAGLGIMGTWRVQALNDALERRDLEAWALGGTMEGALRCAVQKHRLASRDDGTALARGAIKALGPFVRTVGATTGLSIPAPLNPPEQLGDLLRDSEAVVEIGCCTGGIYWRMSQPGQHGRPTLWTSENSGCTLERKVARAVAALQSLDARAVALISTPGQPTKKPPLFDNRAFSRVLIKQQALCRFLRSVLWPPWLAEWAPSLKRLYIAPRGELQRLSFSAVLGPAAEAPADLPVELRILPSSGLFAQRCRIASDTSPGVRIAQAFLAWPVVRAAVALVEREAKACGQPVFMADAEVRGFRWLLEHMGTSMLLVHLARLDHGALGIGAGRAAQELSRLLLDCMRPLRHKPRLLLVHGCHAGAHRQMGRAVVGAVHSFLAAGAPCVIGSPYYLTGMHLQVASDSGLFKHLFEGSLGPDEWTRDASHAFLKYGQDPSTRKPGALFRLPTFASGYQVFGTGDHDVSGTS